MPGTPKTPLEWVEYITMELGRQEHQHQRWLTIQIVHSWAWDWLSIRVRRFFLTNWSVVDKSVNMEIQDKLKKLVRENGEVLLKLRNKKSAMYFSIWLTSCRIDYRFIPTCEDQDDLFYDQDEDGEYLFWIKKKDWIQIKDDISWEEE